MEYAKPSFSVNSACTKPCHWRVIEPDKKRCYLARFVNGVCSAFKSIEKDTNEKRK